jgi:hypothetical protein
MYTYKLTLTLFELPGTGAQLYWRQVGFVSRPPASRTVLPIGRIFGRITQKGLVKICAAEQISVRIFVKYLPKGAEKGLKTFS